MMKKIKCPCGCIDRASKTPDEALRLWNRMMNIMSWLRGGEKLSYPRHEYEAHLYRYLGYWRHTPLEVRQAAKMMKRLGVEDIY